MSSQKRYLMSFSSREDVVKVLAANSVQRQHFYPRVVYIIKSNSSLTVIFLKVGFNILLSIPSSNKNSFLQSLVLLILSGKLMRKLQPIQCA